MSSLFFVWIRSRTSSSIQGLKGRTRSDQRRNPERQASPVLLKKFSLKTLKTKVCCYSVCMIAVVSSLNLCQITLIYILLLMEFYRYSTENLNQIRNRSILLLHFFNPEKQIDADQTSNEQIITGSNEHWVLCRLFSCNVCAGWRKGIQIKYQ